jgi:ankyrin repeat domain-containing protein 50
MRVRSIIVERLRRDFGSDPTTGIACVYCNYKEQEIQTAANLLAGIWMQLSYDHDLPPALYDMYSESVLKGANPTLENVLQALQQVMTTYKKVFVVVDALDECLEGNKTGLILLRELCKYQPKVNILVTSRHYKNTTDNIINNFAVIDITAQDQDIKKYINTRLQLEPLLTQYIDKEPTLKDEIVQKLCHAAGGM